MKTVLLGDVCEIFAGGDIPKGAVSKTKNYDYNIPIYTNGEKDDGLYAYTNVARVTEPSVTISARGTIGYSSIRLEKFYPAVRLIVLTPDPRTLDIRYLFYAVKNIDFGNTGTSIPQLTVPMIKKYHMQLVTIEEQKRIVGELDEAFAAIDKAKRNTEKNLKNFQELFISELEKIFYEQGNILRIKDFAEVKGGKRVPKGEKLQTEKTPYPYIRVTDFNDKGSVDLADIRYVSEKVYDQIARYKIYTEDLYISIAGTIGKTGIIPPELNGANLTENACRLLLDESVNNKYLYYFTKTKSFMDQAGLSTRTTAMPKMALVRLKEIEVPVPTLSEQLDLVKKFYTLSVKTRKLQKLHQQKLNNLEELKQSILKQAFEGKL